VMLSAYMLIFAFWSKSLFISCKAILNRVELSTDPHGIPLCTLALVEIVWFTFVWTPLS
jgi:hypothetical protein